MKLSVIYQDKNILAINKPAGVDVYAVEKELAKKFKKIQLVHRLDKGTTGVLLLAKNEKAHAWLKEQFQERTVKKTYHLLVSGELKAEEGRLTGTINLPIGRHRSDARRRATGRTATAPFREAVTHYRILENFDRQATYLEARLETGRTHQLRVHFQSLGHPVLGDKLYGSKRQTDSLPRQMLHAYALTIALSTGETKTFTSPLPTDFKKALAGLSKL